MFSNWICTIFVLCFVGYSRAQNNIPWLCRNSAYAHLCVELGEKTYLIDSTQKINFHNAERFCHRENGTLANIETAAEMDLITQHLLSRNFKPATDFFWIGAHCLGSQRRFISTKTGFDMPFTRWALKQPDNANGNEHCVHMCKFIETYGMNDNNCMKAMHFICEMPPPKTIYLYPNF